MSDSELNRKEEVVEEEVYDKNPDEEVEEEEEDVSPEASGDEVDDEIEEIDDTSDAESSENQNGVGKEKEPIKNGAQKKGNLEPSQQLKRKSDVVIVDDDDEGTDEALAEKKAKVGEPDGNEAAAVEAESTA